MADAVETTKRTHVGEQRVILRDVGWEGYEALLAMVGDGHVRLAFDGTDVELRGSSLDHEVDKTILNRLIGSVTFELDLNLIALGATTWRRKDRQRGLEADECYYLANFRRISRKKQIDLTVDPPPDLAVDIEMTEPLLYREGIYAALGFPEVWKFDGDQLLIQVLQTDGTYSTTEVSPSLPMITPKEVAHWVRQADGIDHTTWAKRFRSWIHEVLSPRYKAR